MRTIVKIAITKCWLDMATAAFAAAAWVYSTYYTKPLFADSSVAEFIFNSVLFIIAIVLGAIAIDRIAFAVVHEPRQLIVEVTDSKVVINTSGTRYAYHFDGGLVHVPTSEGERAYPGDQLSFWYMPVNTINVAKMVIYDRTWGHEIV